jgi:hypothetical protein
MSNTAPTLQTLLDHFILADVHRDGLVPQLQATPEGFRYWRQLSDASVLICRAHDAGDPVLAGVRHFLRERWGGIDRAVLDRAIDWLAVEHGLTREQALALPLADLLARLRPPAPTVPAVQATEEPAPAPRPKKPMTVAQANRQAQKLARRVGPAFFAVSEREQARQIGCAWQTWAKTEFYQTARARKERAEPGKAARPPAAVSLTSEMEAALGDGGRDAVLEELVAEQAADNEPSPLDPDPPDKPVKVYTPRQRL